MKLSVDENGWVKKGLQAIKDHESFEILLTRQSLVNVAETIGKRANPIGPILSSVIEKLLSLLGLPVITAEPAIHALAAAVEGLAALGAVDGALGAVVVVCEVANRSGYDLSIEIPSAKTKGFLIKGVWKPSN